MQVFFRHARNDVCMCKLILTGRHDLNNDGNYQYPRCKLSVTLAVRVVFCKADYCSLLPTWIFLPCKACGCFIRI